MIDFIDSFDLRLGPILVVTCHYSVSWLVAWLTYQPNDMALALETVQDF